MDKQISSQKIQTLTDTELYKRCQEYGGNARLWLRKFGGLLPEVYHRHLYKKKKFISIYEFAAKLAGMSERTVDKILNLSKKFEDKPALRSKLEEGTAGWSKLEKVASVATKETDKEWAKKVEILGTPALVVYIQKYRALQDSGLEVSVTDIGHGEHNSSLLEGVQAENMDRRESCWKTLSFPMSPKTELKLRSLKQQFEQEKKQAMSWNEVMMEMAQRLEAQAKEPKVQKIIELCPNCVQHRANEAEKNYDVTRYIPAEVKNVIETRSGGKCEFPSCNYPPEIYHHTRRFALKKNHDPTFIRALCKKHEGILQAGLVANEEGNPSTWNIRAAPEWWDMKNIIDEKVAVFRREPKFPAL